MNRIEIQPVLLLQKTDTGSITPFWNTAKSNQISSLDFDKKALTSLVDLMATGTPQAEAMRVALIGASDGAKVFAAQGDFAAKSIDDWYKAELTAIQSTGRFKGAISALGSVVKNLGMSFLNMGIALVASFALDWVVKQIDNWVHAGERAIQTAEELSTAWSDADQKLTENKAKLDGISSEYAKLAKGVDSFGQNVSLTSDEFARYNELSNQIADMFPTLITGWTDQGTAILGAADSVEKLNKAYQEARDEQNRKILSEAQDVQKGIGVTLNGDGKFGSYGISTEQDTIAKIRTMLAPTSNEELTRYVMANQEQIKNIIKESGAGEITWSTTLQDEVKMLQESEGKLVAYSNTLADTVDNDVDSIRRGIMAGLELTDYYKNLPDEQKAALSKVVQAMSPETIANGIPNTSNGIENWVQENFVNAFKGVDLSGILNAKSLFDSSKITVDNYKKYASDFANQIKNMAPEVQDALNETFSPNTDTLEENVKGKLIDAYDNSVGSLTLDQLKIAADIQLDGGALLSWDQLTAKIQAATTAASQSTDVLGASVTTLKEQYTLLGSAISEQAENGAMSYDTYTKLIAANSEFADSCEVVDGRLQINADSAYKLVDANAKLAESEAKAAEEAAKQDYYKVAEQLSDVQDRIEAIADDGDHFGIYDDLVNQEDELRAQLELLDQQIKSYESISSEIQNMYSAYTKFKAAQQTPNSGQVFDSGADEMKSTLKEAIKSKALNTDEVKSAIDFYVGEGDNSQAGLKKRSKQAQEIADRYFTEKNPLTGLNNFQNDLLNKKKMGDLSKYISKDKNGKLQLADGITAEDIAKQLGMSTDAVSSLFEKWKEYDADANWDSLYEKLFPSTDKTEGKETPIAQAADKITEEQTTFEGKAKAAIALANAWWVKIREAFNGGGSTTGSTTGGKTGSTTGGGSTTTGPVSSVENRNNEGLTTSGTTQAPPANIAAPTYTVIVNAQVGQALSGADLVLGSTVGANGEVTYSVVANGTPGLTVSKESVVMNLNEDGSYDVFVDGTPGKTVGPDSIVLGTDANGNLSVTANGAAGQLLNANDLIVGIDQNSGQFYVITRGKVETQVGKTELVSGLNTDGALDVPVNATTGATVDKSSLIIGLNQDGKYDVTVNGEAGTAVPESGLVANLQPDGSLKVTVFGDPQNPITPDSIIIEKDPDGTYHAIVNGKAQDTVSKGDVLIGYDTETDSWIGYVDATPRTTTTADQMTGATNGTYSTTVNANTQSAMDKVAELQAAATEPAEKVITVTYEPEPSHGGYTPSPTPSPSRSSSSSSSSSESSSSSTSSSAPLTTGNTVQVSADIDPAQLNQQIQSAGKAADGVLITADANSEESKKKARELQAYIEALNPELKVTIKYQLPTLPGNAKGTKKAKPGPSLVDEKGAEVIEHTDGTYEVGTDKGPRITMLQKDDVVHDATESKGILRRGLAKVKGFFGQRYASGTLPSAGGGGSDSNSSSSKKNTKGVNWKKYIDKLFDWIEIRLKRLQSVTDKWKRQIEDAVGYLAKNQATDSTVSAMTDQINALNAAYSHYMEQANTVAKKTKLSQNIINAIQNGTIDISSYDSKTQEKIKAYQEWWEKAQDVKDQIEDIKDEQEELIHQKMDNIINQYKDLTDVIDAAKDKAQANIDLKKSTGKEVTAADYQPEINAQVKKIATMQEEYNVLKAEFDKQLADGTLVAGSEAYYQYLDQLNDLDTEIINSKTDLADLNAEVSQLALTNLGNVLKNFQAVQASIQGTLDLIQAQGRIVTTDLYKEMIANGSQQIANLEQQNSLLKQQQAGLDVNSDKYQEIQDQIDSNLQSINDIKVSQEEWNDSILDLRIDELNRMKDALSETNDEYQRQYDIQQAIEDLERAKSQRKIRILENGKWKYVADTEAIADAQKALDDKRHEEDLAKIDDVIDAIEDLKESSNVYASQGLSSITLNDLFPDASIEDILKGVYASAQAGTSLAELVASMNDMVSNVVNNSSRNDTSITVSPNAIVINTTEADPEKIAQYTVDKLSTELITAFTQKEYE